jgi:hypothetical protein
MKKFIAFIGDSFCSTYGTSDFNDNGSQWRQFGTDAPTHPDLVVKHFDAVIDPCGYGGRSWWYSRSKFEYKWNWRFDEIQKQFKALIFFHTDHSRINNSWNDKLGMLQNARGDGAAGRAVESYYQHINDEDFDYWAQEQWFREIDRRYGHVKTVHFHCFPDTVKIGSLLPGIVFDTPLIHISIGELTGTDDAITKQMGAEESRHNHLSAQNNQALAQVIINAIEQLTPGHYDIPMDRFEIINPNATKWPKPRYGTE